MEAKNPAVSVTDFRNLLLSIILDHDAVCIRFRTIGDLWYPNFVRILSLRDHRAALFHDDARKETITLSDLSRVIQFELNRHLHSFEPHFQYEILNEQ